MPRIILHRLTDLPPVLAVPVGEQQGSSQRFNLIPTAITRRLYTVHVPGPHEPAVYVVQITSLGQHPLQSMPIAVQHGQENGLITAEIVGPIFGEFVIDVVKVGDVPPPASPDAPSGSPEPAMD